MIPNNSKLNDGNIEELELPRLNVDRNVYCLFGIPVDALSMKETIAELKRAMDDGRRCVWSTPNLNHLTSCLKSPEFRDILTQSQLSTIDGMPLAILARLLRIPITERVPGSTAFDEMIKGAAGAVKVFFFGGPEGVAPKASQRLADLSPFVRSAGNHSPGYGSIESMSDSATLEKINRAGADFLVLALNAKRGHSWISLNAERLNVPVIAHLGSVINFVAGSVRRSPELLQRAGLEWLWRIWEEPYLASRYRDDFIDLVSLMATRALPLLVLDPVARLAGSRGQDFALGVRPHAGGIELTLHGWVAGPSLKRVKEALQNHADEGGELLICLADTSYVDAELLGLLLILRGWRQQAALPLRIRPPRRAMVRNLVRLHCADYLISH